MFRRKTRRRRREFLLDSNQTHRPKGRKIRNRMMNLVVQFLFLRQIARLFRTSFLVSFIFSLITLFILIALFSPYFDIKKIAFLRDDPRLDIELLEESVADFYGKNLLLLSHQKMKNHLYDIFPEFETIDIQEKWPSEVELKVTLSPPFVNILNHELANFWVVTKSGIVLQKEAQEGLPLITVFQHEKPITHRQKFLKTEELEKIFAARDFIHQELDLKISELHLFYVSKEVHLITENNFSIWIDLAQDIEPQVRKLKLAEEKIDFYFSPLEHIDLRIPNQIFWK